MASDILHIKDAYYFEVPKVLWPANYDNLGEVPGFLLKLHAKDLHLGYLDQAKDPKNFTAKEIEDYYKTQEFSDHSPAEKVALKEYNSQMTGKIVIPQPFGELKTLYTKDSGFAISKFMILELIVAVFMVVVFNWMRKKMATEHPTKGRLANLLETFLHFIREDIAKKNIGHDADKFVPLLWTVFFFILGCNLFGMVPWMGTATGALGTTLALAFSILLATFFAGFSTFGPKWIVTGFVPHMDLPTWLFPLKVLIMLMIYVIELLGMFIKHAVLAIRLLANMAAGHLVLLGIMGLILAAAGNAQANFAMTAPIAIIGATLLSVMELGVAFLQAYVFTLLSALFIGSAAHEH